MPAGNGNGRFDFCHSVARGIDEILTQERYTLDFRQRARTTALNTAAGLYAASSQPSEKEATAKALTEIRKEFAQDCRWGLEDLLEKNGSSDRIEEAMKIIDVENYRTEGERSADKVVEAVAAAIAH